MLDSDQGPLANGWLAFIFGCVALLIVLVLYLVAFFLPPPSDARILEKFLDALQVILALATAGVAAVIPGWIVVKLKWNLPRGVLLGIDAGGAIAVFALVFLVDPSSLTKAAVQRRLTYNEMASHCAEGARWQVTRAPRSGTLAQCLAAIQLDPKRWEAYRHTAAYYYYYRDYARVGDYYQRALLAFTETKTLAAAFEFRPSPLTAPTYIGLLRGVVIGEIGAWLEKGSLDANRATTALNRAGAIYATTGALDKQLASDLSYTDAMLEHILWRTANATNLQTWGAVRDAWNDAIRKTDGTLTWHYYHVACLHAEVLGKEESAAQRDHLKQEINTALDQAISSVMLNKEYFEQNQSLMRCMLFGGKECVPPWAGDPLECRPLRYQLEQSPASADRFRQQLNAGVAS